MAMRLLSPVTCIMFGCSPGLILLASFGFFRSLTSQLLNLVADEAARRTGSGRPATDAGRPAACLPSHSLRVVYLPSSAPLPHPDRIVQGAEGEAVVGPFSFRVTSGTPGERRPVVSFCSILRSRKSQMSRSLPKSFEVHLRQRLLVVVHRT